MTEAIKNYILEHVAANEEDLTRHTGRRTKNDVSVSREIYIHLRRVSSAIIHGRPDTYVAIAAELGYSDHTPAVKAHRRLQKIMSVDRHTKADIEKMENELREMIEAESRQLLRAHYGLLGSRPAA
jgi:chromosomal replication initiation ATPase DnaA